jgi:hypothetical protein
MTEPMPFAIISVPRPSGPVCRMSRAKIGNNWVYGMIRKAGIAWSEVRARTVESSQT